MVVTVVVVVVVVVVMMVVSAEWIRVRVCLLFAARQQGGTQREH